jgi:hypothetical protein
VLEEHALVLCTWCGLVWCGVGRCGVVWCVCVEIVTPSVDGILYCKTRVPDDNVNDMHAMMQEQLKPATPLALQALHHEIDHQEGDGHEWEPLRQPVDLQVEK